MGKYLPILVTAQCGSINKAAEQLGYAQPSLWYIIKKIEDDLGVKLFYRQKRGVVPTEVGYKLLSVMERIEEQETALAHIAHAFQENYLRIGTFPGIPSRWISELLAAMAKQSPETLVQLETFSCYQDGLDLMKKYALNLCFSTVGNIQGLSSITLCEDPYYLVISAEHPLAQREEVSMNDMLGRIPLIPNHESYDPNGALWALYQTTKHVILADSTPPDNIFSVALAEKGLGAALLPGLLLREMHCRNTVRILPLVDGPVRTLYLLCPPEEDRSAAVSSCIDLAMRITEKESF